MGDAVARRLDGCRALSLIQNLCLTVCPAAGPRGAVSGGSSMKIAVVGSRFFGAAAFEALRKEPGVEIAGVVAPAADDRLAIAAKEANVPVHVLANPKMVPGEAIPEGTDLIVAAHTHARVSDEA